MEGEPVLALSWTLQKAEELRQRLGYWRERLHLSSSSASASCAGDARASWSSSGATRGVKKQSETDVVAEGAWHRLSSYILELERRVRELEEGAAAAGQRFPGASEESGTGHTDADLAVTGPDETAEKIDQMDGTGQALLLIFSWLTTSELCIASQVCQIWHKVASHPQLWRRIFIRETVISSQALAGLQRYCSLTNSISLHGLMPEMAGPDEELQSYIARQRGSLEPGLAALLSSAPQLTSLSVTECNLMITERLLWLASVHCPGLRQFTYCSDEFPPSPAALWALANGCPELLSLHLPPYRTSPFLTHFNDYCLSTIANGWPSLLQLTVGGPSMTATGLKEIVSRCCRLEVLKVEYGPKLSFSDVKDITSSGGLTRLHSLSFLFTAISPKALYQLSAACPHLASLTIHISLDTYFPGTFVDTAMVKTYHQICTNFEELQQMMKGVLYLHHYSATNNTVT